MNKLGMMIDISHISDKASLEAIKLSSSVVDTSVALGISVTEAGDLIGSFKALAGLSADQATTLAKNVTLLAKASDVAPQQILRDMAEASQEIAGFTDATGENIARAAIQARKLGLALSEVATSAQSLLDYQQSYQNSLEASVLVGRNINVQKLQELSLAGDLEGLPLEFANKKVEIMGDTLKILKEERNK